MKALSDNGLPPLGRVLVWFNDPSNWVGGSGLLQRALEHIVYTAAIVLVAALIALPIGAVLGHTGRGIRAVSATANVLRAVPALGLLVFLILIVSPAIGIRAGLGPLVPQGSIPYLVPVVIVLLILAVPPILSSTYAGIQSVDPAARDAARGMGMNAAQVVWRVELPNALPLIVSGIRSATLQVIASLTVAAYAPLVGGLGRFIVDGNQNLADLRYGYPAMVAAGLTIAVLALLCDGALSLVRPRRRPPRQETA